MGALADLQYLGAPVADGAATAKFIGGMILTRRQKGSLLLDYLRDARLSASFDVRKAASGYAVESDFFV